MIDTAYVKAGMNVVKCEHCGFDGQGKPRTDGGNVFLSVDLDLYEVIRHDCAHMIKGRCKKCKRISHTKLIHPLAPKASEQTIRDITHAVLNRVG